MGFYSPSQLVQDGRRHQIEVCPIDVCHSNWEHSLETDTADEPAIRLGLCLIKGFSCNTAAKIIATRTRQSFNSITQLTRTAELSQSDLALLSSAGALRSLTSNRRQAQWDALAIEQYRPLLDAPAEPLTQALPSILSAPSEVEELNADYSTVGLTLGRHPMEILRQQSSLLQRCKRSTDLAALGNRRFVRIAGLVTGRQRPGTASGVIFLTLEDETGNSNIVVWTSVQTRCREALLKAHLLMVKGVVETDGNVVHVVAQELTDISSLEAPV